MATIAVKLINEECFEVTVQDASTTAHRITVNLNYALMLTQGKINTQSLIEKSFEFLLARESNTSILRSFDLSVISRYFPEYESTISQQAI